MYLSINHLHVDICKYRKKCVLHFKLRQYVVNTFVAIKFLLLRNIFQSSILYLASLSICLPTHLKCIKSSLIKIKRSIHCFMYCVHETKNLLICQQSYQLSKQKYLSASYLWQKGLCQLSVPLSYSSSCHHNKHILSHSKCRKLKHVPLQFPSYTNL
jgi:hypothetical protein